MANGVLFQKDKKEPFMMGTNPFIESHMKLLADTFDQFSTIPNNDSNVASQPSISITDEQREMDLGLLHHHLTMNLDKIARILQTTDSKSQNRSAGYERLTAILRKLGQPPDVSTKRTEEYKSSSGNKNDSTLYDNFMKTKASLNTDKIKEKNIYYKHGMTKEKYPVFYLITRRFKNNDPDVAMDSLLYYILKTTESSFSKPFVIVVDCTLFSTQNQMPQSWASYFAKHFPSVGDNLAKIIIVNPNHEFKSYSKGIRKFLGRGLKKVEVITNCLKLNQFIPDNDIGLPAETRKFPFLIVLSINMLNE
jgi:neurofibromin 1